MTPDSGRCHRACSPGRRSQLRLGVRRAHRGCRGRAIADHEQVARDPRLGRTAGRAHLGQPARGAEPRPGGLDRLSHHHHDARSHREARSPGQGSRRILARDRPDVSVRTHCPPDSGSETRAEGSHHRRGWIHRQHPGGSAECRGSRGRHLRQPVPGTEGVHLRCVRQPGSRVRARRRARRASGFGGRSMAATPSSTSRRTRTCVTGSTIPGEISSRTRSRPLSCSRRCEPQASTASPSRPPARCTESPRSSPHPRRARSRCKPRCTAHRSSRGRV